MIPRLASVVLCVLLARETIQAGAKKAEPFQPLEINGQLADTDPRDRKLNQPCKLHRFDLVAGKTYVIDLLGKNFDAYLRLEDPTGKPLAEDDDSGGDLNARITYTPTTTGNYQVSATTLNGAVGPYTLRLRQTDALKEARLKLGKALDVAGGLKIENMLDATTDPKSPVFPKNACKVYSVKMTANQTYVINLDSNAFDAYLHVLDGNLQSLAKDDDGGGNLNAQLSFRPPSDGTYHILATALNGQPGAFTLRVRTQKH